MVDSPLDSNARDNVLTLREALLVQRGDLALDALTAAEQSQIQLNAPGLTTDMIQFDPTLAGSTITFSSNDASSANQYGPTGFVVTTAVAIDGSAGSGPGVTISGGGTERLFAVTSTGDLTLSNLTLTGGLAEGGSGVNGGGGAAGLGGAVFVDQGSLTIFASTLTGNMAEGGSSNSDSFLGLPAVGGGGGGLAEDAQAGEDPGAGGGPNGGARGTSSAHNGTPGGFGGGGGGGWNLGDGFFPPAGHGGAGGFGGGGGGEGENSGYSTMGGGTHTLGTGGQGGFGGGGGGNGSSNGGFGGGANGGGGAGLGGALFSNAGSVTITDSTLTANSAEGGGAGGGTGGTGEGFGGAVFARNGTLTIAFSTFTANTANSGGTDAYILADATNGGGGDTANTGSASVTLTDSILGQTDNSVTDLVTATNGTGTTVTAAGSFNLIRNTAVAGVGVVSTADPLLGPLADNGGPTHTMLPLGGSPAIDAGVPSNPGLATDQRGAGFPRVEDGLVDLGAVESQMSSPVPVIDPLIVPVGGVASSYSTLISVAGPDGPYSFTVSNGSLPAGLALTATSDPSGRFALLAGTPTTAETDSFTITVTNPDGATASQAYTMTVLPPVTIDQESLPNGQIGIPYSLTLTASGATAPFKFAVTAGTLPAGLSLSSAGTLSGTPTTVRVSSFTITATSAVGFAGSQAYTLTVPNPFVVTSLADDNSSGTLRYVLGQANSYSYVGTGPRIINFAVDGTIHLTQGALTESWILGEVTIDATGHSITLDAGHLSQVFKVEEGILALTGMTIVNGSYSGGNFSGGAIYNGGYLTLTNDTFTGNYSLYGGAIYDDCWLSITACTFTGNTARYNGGAIDTSTISTLGVESSTFTGNTASDDGGALYSEGSDDNLAWITVLDSTITGNQSAVGGGIGGINAPLRIGGSIVSGNSYPDVQASIQTDLGYNLLGTSLLGPNSGVGDIFTNTPQVAALADNGGPTETMALTAGSPEIDAGNPADTTPDQRGVAVQNGRRDMGVFEDPSVSAGPATQLVVVTEPSRGHRRWRAPSDLSFKPKTPLATWPGSPAMSP